MCHCNDKNCCSSGSSKCGCGSSSCGCGSACHCSSSCGCRKGGECREGCDYASKFLEVADCAWMEVLKEKIKEQIRAEGKHLDELARIITQANREKWHGKMACKGRCSEYKQELHHFFCENCNKKN